jgi:hypothetical protein
MVVISTASPAAQPAQQQAQQRRGMSPSTLASVMASTNAFSMVATAVHETFLDRMAYVMQRLSTAPVFIKITVLFMAGAPALAAGPPPHPPPSHAHPSCCRAPATGASHRSA